MSFHCASSFQTVIRALVTTLICLSWVCNGTSIEPSYHFKPDYQIVPAKRKLERIILPNVEFHQTTLRDAVDFLREESRRVDGDPDPGRRGVNLILANSPGTSTRITLTLHNIPLSEALKYVAAQAGLKVKTEFYAASLVPLTENDAPLVTAVFRVSPTFFDLKPAAGVKGTLD